MKLLTTLNRILLLAILAVAAGLAIWLYKSPTAPEIKMEQARIADIKPLIRLCTMDLYEDVPMKGDVGPKHIVARVTLTGSISFDLENIEMDERNDSIFVVLPPEIVDIYESTDAESYRVIDTWNDNFFGSSTFTTAEENSLKSKLRERYRAKVYAKGYVRRARSEAKDNITRLLANISGKTVIVTDPTPNGTPGGI